ncbi:MAG: tRNA (guanosine(46)-N7)-methyltransferase TrmB [Pseudanabaenaceae cyanobacterium]
MVIKRLRLREHVNPLSRRYQVPTPPPSWSAVYANPDLPLSLDIGCGHGEYLLAMAQVYRDRNFLGIEIRKPLVEQANAVKDALGLQNLYYLFANVNVSLGGLFTKPWLNEVTIQFPDPWFKRKQRKRRMVNAALVATLIKFLLPSARILLQSDMDWLLAEMKDCFLGFPQFRELPTYPEHIPTDRETMTLRRGFPVYRCALVYESEHPPCPPI